MNPEQIRSLLRKTPFEPFRIHVTGGKWYDIRHPEAVIPGASSLYIGVGDRHVNETTEIPDLVEIVSNLHLIRIEPHVKPQPAA